jgi:hypothetical protein
MAQDKPTATELLEAVREFLEKDILPEMKGGKAFHTRVAVNVLGIVGRELAQGPACDAQEHAELRALLGHDGAIPELVKELAERIRDGALDARRTEVMAHVRKTVENKLRIANPAYLEAS